MILLTHIHQDFRHNFFDLHVTNLLPCVGFDVHVYFEILGDLIRFFLKG